MGNENSAAMAGKKLRAPLIFLAITCNPRISSCKTGKAAEECDRLKQAAKAKRRGEAWAKRLAMPSKLKTMRAYFIRGFLVAWGAVLFWGMTYWLIWNTTSRNMLIAYLSNGFAILAAIIHDKLRMGHIRKKKKNPFGGKVLSMLFDYVVLEKYNLTSIKSSLYLFYIFALVSSHILMVNPHIEVSESVRNYFTTVGYGLLLLVAIDKFTDRLVKDDKEIKAYENDDEHE